MKRKITSIFLIFTILFSLFSMPEIYAEKTGYTTEEKTMRQVYLHAQGENPETTLNTSTVYMGDTFDLYFAVDDPNKGDYRDGKHLEPQYDMNGYTVKIYFESGYFDFASTTKTSAQYPIDYTIPDKNIPTSETKDENVEDGNTAENTPTTVGYYIHKLGSDTGVEVNGRIYNVAYATVFFSGEYVPQKDKDTLWYNLCSLPLIPKKTGNTDVFLEIETNDEFSLELFAKDAGEEYSPDFDVAAVNGGYHHINIQNKLKPSVPIANPSSGSYIEKKEVSLKADDDCNIFFSTDGGSTYSLYTQPLIIEYSREIFCYSQRKSDGKVSNTVSFEYKIIPQPPAVFSDDMLPVPNVYSENSEYDVYVSDNAFFTDIADGSEVYYTFASVGADKISQAGDNPETQWVKVSKPKQYQKIRIDKKRVLRLITVKAGSYGEEYSDISWYYLSVRPAPVTANPESGIYDSKQTVILGCETKGAEIYYTINGEDPRQNGIRYSVPLVLNKDTTLKSASFYDGEWSELKSYWYVFNLDDDYGVEAFYPSGIYEGSVNVTLTPNNPENTVIYSVNGGNTWQPYTKTVELQADTEIIAKSVDKNGICGEEYKFIYVIRPHAPIFAPESTQFTNIDEIYLYCPESTSDNTHRYQLFYTTDGTDPITSDTVIQADDRSDSAQIPIDKYTVIRAVIRRDNITYSSVVSHSYDIVVSKPVKPITTLIPGYYSFGIGDNLYTTQFAPVPKGTKIYYTIAYGDEIKPDPVVNEAIEYNGQNIPIKGKTLIKAVAVNVFGAKSDIGIFEYIITPSAPIAAPSATISGDKLPVVPVYTVPYGTVTYTIGDFTNEFVVYDSIFYIDTSTGEAFSDSECTHRIGKESSYTNGNKAILSISAMLEGIKSAENNYVYSLSHDSDVLAAPYADKATGTYEEINIDGENNYLVVSLYSLNQNADIRYMKDNSGVWEMYDGTPLKLKADTVLQLQCKKDNLVSSVESYIYEFVPLPPIITLPSGRYNRDPVPATEIVFDSRVPTQDYEAYIFYRANGDPYDFRYNGEREINKTMSFKAYVKNYRTGKKSKNTINYYIIESENALYGSVYTAFPYEVNPGDTKFISANSLDKDYYNEGIKLYTQRNDVNINYYYSYTKKDGSAEVETETFIYDNSFPIFVNRSMSDITVTAWLTDTEGNEIDNSKSLFNYVFVELKTPVTTLYKADSTRVEYPERTAFKWINDYPSDKYSVLYYTTDNSDPSSVSNASRKMYEGEDVVISKDMTVKGVYLRACSLCGACKDDNIINCTNAVYSDIGEYKYSIPTVVVKDSGGGGGGGVVEKVIDNTRKYTVDIFNREHPTHIGYINGYPDGTVKPEGNITREEIASILYRIKNKEYDKPFEATGEIFPDVSKDRWSSFEIEYMYNTDTIKGYPDGTFKPSKSLTRAEFAAMISRFAALENSSAKNHFNDLDNGHWAYDYIMKLCYAGLIEGYPDGSFKPENAITRAEVMTVINKLLGRNPSEEYVKSLEFNPFRDLYDDKWYYVIVLEATITHNYYLEDEYEVRWEDCK